MKVTSPSDVYGIVFDHWNDQEPFQDTLEFGNLYNIKFKKSIRNFYFCDPETAPRSYYDCYAQLMSYADATNCPKNCISSRTSQGYLPLMKDLSKLKNCTSTEQLCVEKDVHNSIQFKDDTNCPMPCNLTTFTAKLEYKDYGLEKSSQILNLFITYPSSSIIVYEEYPIYDFRGMLGSVGGSLGICVGFSIFDVLSRIVDKIFGV